MPWARPTSGLAGWLMLVLAPGLAEAQAVPAPRPSGRHALLVACTKYPHLLPSRQLVGPANDVVLMRSLLVERFSFPSAHIVTLAEDAGGAELRPTRANIEREFHRLAQQAQAGDQVVILLAGHGSQQPQPDPPPPDDVEPDGLDEIFLPRDFQAWDGTTATPRNAIVDREFKVWLKAICDKQAFVWLIADTCHAGTVIRGARGETLRRVPPETILAPAALEAGARRPVRPPPEGLVARSRFAPTSQPGDAGHLVAIYASSAAEATLETELPPDSVDQKKFGLLTYTLNLVLSRSAAPLTYRELVQRIHQQYVQWGRNSPTPGVDGPDQDREVLGLREWPQRSRMLLGRKSETGPWTINAGALHGLTAGTILAVYPAAGAAGGDSPSGHVQVRELHIFEAGVVPCPFGSLPVRDNLPLGGRCVPVLVVHGLQRLRVAAHDRATGRDGRTVNAGIQQVRTAVESLAGRTGALIAVSDQPSEADWQVLEEGGQLYLVPVHGWSHRSQVASLPRAPASAPALFGPIPLGDGLQRWLAERLNQIARAQNLLKLTAAEELFPHKPSSLRVVVDALRYRDNADQEGQVLRWTAEGITLREGDLIAFRMENRSSVPIDVSLLAVDSGFGITPFFPTASELGDNRLPPGGTLLTGRGRIESATTGLEHMVVIAVQGQGPIADFSCFAQPTLPRARRGAGGRSLYPAVDTPLGELMQNVMFAPGTTRGVGLQAAESYTLRLLSWHTEPKPPLPSRGANSSSDNGR